MRRKSRYCLRAACDRFAQCCLSFLWNEILEWLVDQNGVGALLVCTKCQTQGHLMGLVKPSHLHHSGKCFGASLNSGFETQSREATKRGDPEENSFNIEGGGIGWLKLVINRPLNRCNNPSLYVYPSVLPVRTDKRRTALRVLRLAIPFAVPWLLVPVLPGAYSCLVTPSLTMESRSDIIKVFPPSVLSTPQLSAPPWARASMQSESCDNKFPSFFKKALIFGDLFASSFGTVGECWESSASRES